MSRHTIVSDRPTHEVVVGFDRPLNLYFATVYNTQHQDDDDEGIVLNVFVRSITELRDIIKPYADLPVLVAKTLMREMVTHDTAMSKIVDHRKTQAQSQ